MIFMVYRDEKYNENTELKGITEIICVKSRHAPGAERPTTSAAATQAWTR